MIQLKKLLKEYGAPVEFVINNSRLDDEFLNSNFSNNLEMKSTKYYDNVYILPNEDFDKFVDWAYSSGYKMDDIQTLNWPR